MADSGSGTSVTVVVPAGSTTPHTPPSGPPPGTLPFTGLALGAVLLAAVLLLVLGGALVRAARPFPRRT